MILQYLPCINKCQSVQPAAVSTVSTPLLWQYCRVSINLNTKHLKLADVYKSCAAGM